MKTFLTIKRLTILFVSLCAGIFLFGGIILMSILLAVLIHFKSTTQFPVDCGIVFGAAVHKNSLPGPGITRRVKTAADLYNQGNIASLYFTGGIGSPFQEKSEAQVMKELAAQYGVENEDMFIEEKSTSTWENLQFTAPMVQNCESIVAISDRYHLARIAFLAKKQGWGRLQTHPAAWIPSFPFEAWSVARETLGLIYYSLYTPGE